MTRLYCDICGVQLRTQGYESGEVKHNLKVDVGGPHLTRIQRDLEVCEKCAKSFRDSYFEFIKNHTKQKGESSNG